MTAYITTNGTIHKCFIRDGEPPREEVGFETVASIKLHGIRTIESQQMPYWEDAIVNAFMAGQNTPRPNWVC